VALIVVVVVVVVMGMGVVMVMVKVLVVSQTWSIVLHGVDWQINGKADGIREFRYGYVNMPFWMICMLDVILFNDNVLRKADECGSCPPLNHRHP
jgi:hypothetical protein